MRPLAKTRFHFQMGDLDPKGWDALLAELADGGEIEPGLRAKPKPTAGSSFRSQGARDASRR